MPQGATGLSRRQRASESESRAPFSSSFSSSDDPFREDSTPFATYGRGAGSIAATTTSSSSSPPAAAAGQSPEGHHLSTQAPTTTMSSFTKRLKTWMPSRDSTGRSKSEEAVNARPKVPPLNTSATASAAPAVPTHRAVTPRGTAASAKSPTTSPRVGAAPTTPRSVPASRHGGLASAPTVPLRRRTTPPPVIMAMPKGSTMASASSLSSPQHPSQQPQRRQSIEVHEPFLEGQHPAAPAAGPTRGSAGHNTITSAATPNNGGGAGRPSAGAEPADGASPFMAKPPAFVGNYARATARLSSSSLPTATHDAASRSQSSSTPCWVTDTSMSTPESLEDEEHRPKNSSHTKAPFFSAAPALGDYVPLIEWLLSRGEHRDIGLPSALVSVTSSTNSTATPRQQQAHFINEDYIAKLCSAATQVLAAEPGLLELTVGTDDTLVVVGDIHGQFQDLYTSVLCQQYDHRRCNPGGLDRHFLFMGDYVDRGPHSLEVVLLLLALKVEYPSLVFLTRGNHEEEKTSRVYGFLTEATSALGAAAGAAVWSAVNKVFLDLPLAAIVKTPNMRFFVTHGGLSPCLHLVDEIAAVNRNRYSAGDITADQDDMVTGLLWSDPTNDVPMYKRNPRGCGFMFGPTASYNFCVENNVDFICRAHQVAMEGYIWTHNDRVVTVFSAPNYCGVNGNKGAVMVVNGHTRRPILKQYDSVEVDDVAPGPRANFPYSAMFS